MLRKQAQHIALPNTMYPIVANYLALNLAIKFLRVNKATYSSVNTNSFWQKKYERHFPHLAKQPSSNWHVEFRNTFNEEYKNLLSSEKKLFSMVKENNFNNAYFSYSNLDLKDNSNKSLTTWAIEVGKRETLNHFYTIAQYNFSNLFTREVNVHKLDGYSRNILYWAAVTGQDLQQFNLLFIQGCLLDAKFLTMKFQALHLAAMYGYYELVLFLLEKQPDLLNQEDALGQTALIWASSKGHNNIVKYLLSQANISLTTSTNEENSESDGRNALHWAVHRNHCDTMQLLLDHGMDVYAQTTKFQHQAIHIAVRANNFKAVKLLIDNYPDLINAEDFNGQTPLIWAASLGFTAIVTYLLTKQNINLNAVSYQRINDAHNGKAATHWALHFGFIEILAALLHAGANTTLAASTMAYQVIHNAVLRNDLDAVNLLIRHDRNLLNQGDQFGQTPLMWAASQGYFDIVEYLILQPDTDLNAVTRRHSTPHYNGMSALHWAIWNGHTEVAILLVRAGADLSLASDTDQLQAIHLAAASNQLTVIKCLLETNPALLNQRDACGQTPLLWAAAKGHMSIINYLQSQPEIDLTATTQLPGIPQHGYNALYWAAEQGHNDVVVSLLKKGMAPSIDMPINTKRLNSETRAKLELAAYIPKRNSQSPYKTCFTFFGLSVCFGYSKTEKIEAATVLKEVAMNGGNKALLSSYKDILNNGQLGSIYRALRI